MYADFRFMTALAFRCCDSLFSCRLPEKEDFMSYTNKPFEELDVLDNFLGAVSTAPYERYRHR